MEHEDPHVDVAVLQISSDSRLQDGDDEEDVVRFLKLNLDRTQELRPDMQWPPREGEDVLFIAMTSQFVGRNANLPSFAKVLSPLQPMRPYKESMGLQSISLSKVKFIPATVGRQSGSFMKGALIILGMIAFAYPTEEEIRQTPDGTSVYYNLGLTLVVPNREGIRKLSMANEPPQCAMSRTLKLRILFLDPQ